MKEYHLDLAGLRTVLRTPHPITISDNLRPFLCAPHSKTDCTIELQPADRLPVFSQAGAWHGPEYYDCPGGSMRIFHCAQPKAPAFAVTELLKDGTIRISVLPDYLSYFAGSTGIFNHRIYAIYLFDCGWYCDGLYQLCTDQVVDW